MTAIPNVIATVVLDSGRAVVTESEYDVYGEVTGRTGTADTEYDFAGEQTDDSTGLQYLRARCYAPNTGGFLAREPLSFGPAWAGPSYGYAVATL